MSENSLGIAATGLVGELLDVPDRLALDFEIGYLLFEANPRRRARARLCVPFLPLADLLVDPRNYPSRDVCLERAYDRPQEAVDRRDMEQRGDADIV